MEFNRRSLLAGATAATVAPLSRARAVMAALSG